MSGDFPVEGVELTLLLVVSDVEESRRFYTDVLGATLSREYGGDSAVVQFQGAWILLVTGGGPTPGKPTVTFAAPSDPDVVSHQLTMRVPDCRAAYETLPKEVRDTGWGADLSRLGPPTHNPAHRQGR